MNPNAKTVRLKTAQDFYSIVGSKFFRVLFVKKDGSERTMIARCGVKKFVVGGGSVQPADLVVTWDTQVNKDLRDMIESDFDAGRASYRSFRLCQLLELQVSGQDIPLRIIH